MSLTNNPYGENELFKGFNSTPLSNDTMRSTNPIAQKAFLDSNNAFKISPNPTSKVRVRPFNAVITKKSLFDGLEEHDPSFDGNFSIKSNPKRLIIKPHVNKDHQISTNEVFPERQSISSIFVATQKEINIPEPFDTKISQVMDQDTDRRVSWLRTVPQKINQDKVKSIDVFDENNTVNQTTIQLESREGDEGSFEGTYYILHENQGNITFN